MSDSSPSDRSGADEAESRLERLEGRLLLAKRSGEVASQRAILEEIRGRLRVDQESLLLDASALRSERDELERELGLVRVRRAALDETLAARRLDEAAKSEALGVARGEVERTRELVRRTEREILDCREQLSAAQERLGGLVKTVLRMQHSLWRTANDETGNED